MNPEPLQNVREPARWRQLREFATRGDTPVSGERGTKTKRCGSLHQFWRT